MTGVALYSPLASFPEELLSRTDVPLQVQSGRLPSGAMQYILRLAPYTMQLNLMEQAQIPQHLEGFAGYVRTIYKNKPDARGQRIIAQILKTKMVIGVVYTPDDADPMMPLSVASAVAEMSKGIMLVRGTLLDYADNLILAPDGRFDQQAIIEPVG